MASAQAAATGSGVLTLTYVHGGGDNAPTNHLSTVRTSSIALPHTAHAPTEG